VRQNPTIGLGGAIKVTTDAESWLKSNLNINMKDLSLNNIEPVRQIRRLQSAHPSRQITNDQDVKMKSWAIKPNTSIDNGLLTEQNKQLFDQISESKSRALPKRPRSAYSRGSNNSRMSNVPEVSSYRLALVAADIYKLRQTLTDQQKADNSNLRETLSSSELQQLFKRVGLPIEIGLIKALLKGLGFNWNGKACSLLQLFQKCQELTSEPEGGQSLNTIQTAPTYKTILDTISKNKPVGDEFVHKIKDLFYATKKSIYDLF
jgi:hypothetical protein